MKVRFLALAGAALLPMLSAQAAEIIINFSGAFTSPYEDPRQFSGFAVYDTNQPAHHPTLYPTTYQLKSSYVHVDGLSDAPYSVGYSFINVLNDQGGYSPDQLVITLNAAYTLVLYDFTGTAISSSLPPQFFAYSEARLVGGIGSGIAEVSFTQAAVPEPATWAMMLIGIGLIGGAMRLRSPSRNGVRSSSFNFAERMG